MVFLRAQVVSVHISCQKICWVFLVRSDCRYNLCAFYVFNIIPEAKEQAFNLFEVLWFRRFYIHSPHKDVCLFSLDLISIRCN
jgi:hypothetical protein